jgi:hypothetical protein
VFGKKDPAGDDIFLRLDATNDPLTGTLQTEDLEPVNDFTRNIGTITPANKRFAKMRAGLGVFIRQSGPGTIEEPTPANQGGLMAGTQGGAVGTNIHRLQGGVFAGAAVIGNTGSTGTGTSTIEATRGGAVVIGSAYCYGAGNCTAQATGYASTVIGYAYGRGNATLAANAPGSTVIGYANSRGTGTTSNLISGGNGAVTFGMSRSTASPGVSRMSSTGQGSFVAGAAISNNGQNATLEATADGAFAQGFSSSNILGPSLIRASGKGSFAQGSAINGQTIEANKTNAVQFGPGVNGLANSLQVGNGGIRFMGITGTPAAPQNGDFWVNNGFVYVRSNNVSIQIAGPGPLTN